MFGFFSRKKKDAKPAVKASGTAKGDAAKKPPGKDASASAAKLAKKKADPQQESLKAAIAALENDAPAPVSAGAQLDKAKDALAKRAAGPMDRKQLIEQALAIQQTQAKMLDKLPDETRQKLRALAMKTFVLDKPTDKKKMN